MDREQETRTMRALNRAAKWRNLLTGWQLGTRAKGDPEADAVRDLRELTIILRIEASAIVGALLDAGVITQERWQFLLEREANAYNDMMAQRFPGVEATDDGLLIDPGRTFQWMKDWKP